MKHLHIHTILTLVLMLLGTVATSAQTPISSEMNWYGNNSVTLSSASPPNGIAVPNSGGYVNHMSSGNRTPDSGLSVTIDQTTYPTYANVLTGSDAFKIRVSGGQGQIRVYYRTGQQVVNSVAITPLTLMVRNGNNGSNTDANAPTNDVDTIQFYANNQTWNTGMPWPRDVYPTSVSVNFTRSSTTKVRAVLHYSDNSEDYVERDGASTTPFTITVTPSARKILNYVAVQNTSGGAGEVGVASIIVNGERDVASGQVNCSLKTDETTTIVAADVYSEGENGTRILTYNYNNANQQTYYIAGGNVGAIQVTYALPSADVSNLVPIENDFFWYYNGGDGLGYNGYTNDNQLYRYFPIKANEDYAVAATSTVVKVNAEVLGTATYHSYQFKTSDALGFKLKRGVSYRIKVHAWVDDGNGNMTNDFAYIYRGNNPSTSTRVEGYQAQWLDDCRPATLYIADGNDEVYWIRQPNGMNLGGIEILPIQQSTLDAVNPINANMQWWLDEPGHNSSQVNLCGNGDGPNVVRNGTYSNTMAVSGPTLAIMGDSFTKHDEHRTVQTNNQTRFGLKLPARARIHIRFTSGSEGQSLAYGNTREATNTYVRTAFDTDFYYPSATEWTTEAQDFWFGGGNTSFIDISGFDVEIQEDEVNIADLNVINGDYVWRGTENSLNANAKFGDNYLYNQGLAKAKSSHTHTVDGSGYYTYDFTPANNKIHFKVANNLTGEIRVFYRDGSAAEDEPLTVSQATMNASWTPTYATVTDNADHTSTVTFTYEGTDQDGVQYPTRGWDMGGTQAYSAVTITLGETPRKAWQILLRYSDGNVGSDYTTNTSITVDIDPSRNLDAIFIQPQGIHYNESFSYKVASATVTTSPNVSGNATAKINDGTSDVSGTTTNIESLSVLSHRFDTNGISDPRTYNIYGGKIAGVEVLVDQYVDGSTPGAQTFNPASLINLSLPSATWRPAQTLGKTINNGTTPMVLNGNRYFNASGNNIHWIEGSDLVINETKVNDGGTVDSNDRSVLLDNSHAIGIKLNGAHRYRLTAYWNDCVSNSLRIYRDQNNPTGGYNRTFSSDDKTVMNTFYSSKPAMFEIDLSDKADSYYEMVWISGTWDTPIYFSGYTIETISEAYIKFDTDQPGIFTGKWRASGDTEDKLLVYCTDNGTQENYVLPRAYYYPVTGSRTDITATALPGTINTGSYGYTITDKAADGTTTLPNLQSTGPGSNNPTTPTVGITDNVPRIVGFEDTDNDRVYRVVYSYYPDANGPAVTDHYYVWFANYLKIGWWTTRDGKLIVDSNKSQDDPDHIITGEFYISSGTEGTLYYEFVNPEMGYTYDLSVPRTVVGRWSYTDDKKQTVSDSRSYNKSEVAKKANMVDNEEYSWTQMNDHRDHTDYALRVGFPSESDLASYWNNGEVVKEIIFKAERPGWPTWSAHMKFHFVRAPKVNCTVNNATSTGTTTMTGYNGSYTATPASNPTIYYTTDGTSPTVSVANPTQPGSSMQPTNATYLYNGTITSTKSTNFYATEMVYVDRPFYVTNPYTIHLEHKTFAQMLADQSRYFPAMSKLGEVAIIDPLVEYCDASTSRFLTRTEQGGGTTTSGFSVTGAGGFVYSYPFGSSATYTTGRMMNVLFGDKSKFVYRSSEGSSFKPVGVYWNQDKDDHFAEHLDATLYKYKTSGENYTDASLSGSNNGMGNYATYTQNGDPHTECNGGIGGTGTENGGLFLQPVTGDFLRFEPEYDGVITVWIRQNGAGQGNEEEGNITRRPVYILDENGKVMKRSTVKPSTEHYFCLNGTYGEINSNKSTMRQDCRIDWINGLRNWKTGYDKKNGGTKPLPLRHMATFRLFNYWYGFPIYQNTNALEHASSTNGAADTFKWTMDVADSWISRTAKVQSVICPWNSLCYHSEALHYNVEQNMNYTGTGGAQNVFLRDQNGASRTIYEGDRFALYGYEMPSYGVVRYRFPVKAGKSYYMGGRGTKNGFMAYKFDRMEANYTPADYNFSDNRTINELNYDCVTINYPTATATKDATYIENSYYHDGEHGYKARHVQIYSRSDADGTPNDYWMNYNNTELNLDGSRGSQQGLTCNVSLWRGFEKDKWYTIVLPFSISESRVKEIFGPDTKILYLDPYDNSMSHDRNSTYKSVANPAVSYNKLRLTYHKYQMLYANVPALICPSENTGQGYNGGGALELPRVTIDKTNLGAEGYFMQNKSINNKNYKVNGIGYKIGEVDGWEYWITGSYEYVPKNTHPEMYFLHGEVVNNEYKTTFYHSGSGIEIQPTRCWIEARPKAGAATNPAPPRLTEITFDNFDFDEPDFDPSGIIDIIMDDYKVEMYDDGNVYDLLGRKVAEGSTDGLPKGIYIFNGEKVYIR